VLLFLIFSWSMYFLVSISYYHFGLIHYWLLLFVSDLWCFLVRWQLIRLKIQSVFHPTHDEIYFYFLSFLFYAWAWHSYAMASGIQYFRSLPYHHCWSIRAQHFVELQINETGLRTLYGMFAWFHHERLYDACRFVPITSRCC
jgi:hypothetical protein